MLAPLKLLCFPCAGASATMYLRWRPSLPSWIQVVPVELPGRGSRLSEKCVEDFDRLIAQLCDELGPVMRGEFVVFGHSMGALLGHGLTARLHAQGRPLPLALLASGSPAPSRRDADTFASKGDDAALVADLRRQGGTPEEVLQSAELLRLTLGVLGADYRVCESFAYAGPRPLPVPLHVFGGRKDDIDAQRLEAWAEEAGEAFTLDWFDGGHFFIRQREAEVIATLNRRLASSVAGGCRAARAFA